MMALEARCFPCSVYYSRRRSEGLAQVKRGNNRREGFGCKGGGMMYGETGLVRNGLKSKDDYLWARKGLDFRHTDENVVPCINYRTRKRDSG